MCKTILSIFDESGQWSAPYVEAGHNVIQIDIQHDPELHDIRKFGVEYLIETLEIDTVDGIIGAPPCTDFTKSGAQYWKQKDANGSTADSVFMVEQFLCCVEYFKPDWYTFENPPGRLPRLVRGIGTPFRFHPSDFAGYVEASLSLDQRALLEELSTRHSRGLPMTKAEIELVKESNRYTKETCLWGRFKDPVKDPRPPIRVCNQGSWLQKLGGKSAATKKARSVTPLGFATAFFNANCWEEKQVVSWAAERAAEWIAYMDAREPATLTDLEVTSIFDPEEHPETTAADALEAFRRLYPPGHEHRRGYACRA